MLVDVRGGAGADRSRCGLRPGFPGAGPVRRRPSGWGQGLGDQQLWLQVSSSQGATRMGSAGLCARAGNQKAPPLTLGSVPQFPYLSSGDSSSL